MIRFMQRCWWLSLVFLALSPCAWAQDAPDPAPKAKAAVLVDAGSGETLYAKNADRPYAIASMTKLMTLYLAFQALAQGKVHADDPVAVSEEAYRTGGSQIWLEPGEILPLGQLLKAIAVGSANDACVAVAEHLAGSVPAFVAQMNRTASALGMTHTHFANPHGLDEPGHYASAADLARLARAAVRMPGLLHLTSLREDRTLRDGKGGHLWLVNHNRLLGQYIGLDGLKTGYTDKAGYCLVATARRGPMRLIAVVMGEPTSKDRFAETSALLSHGFQGWRSVVAVRGGRVFGPVPVTKGMEAKVGAVLTHDVVLTLPRSTSVQLTTRVHLPGSVPAPLARGQVLGKVTVLAGQRVLAERPLVAQRAVARLSMGRLFLRLLAGVLRV